MVYNENNKYAQLARKFLEGKSRKIYYEIVALDEDHMEEVSFLNAFNDDDVKALRDLREKYGKDGFVKHLDELFTDPDEIHDLTCGCEILDINLDKHYHMYRFARHELRGDSLFKSEVLIELPDEWYVRLLSHCIHDKDMNVNKLKYADKFLYDTVISKVDNHLANDGFFDGCYPYLITMDEVKEDARTILAENPELCKTGIMGYLFV